MNKLRIYELGLENNIELEDIIYDGSEAYYPFIAISGKTKKIFGFGGGKKIYSLINIMNEKDAENAPFGTVFGSGKFIYKTYDYEELKTVMLKYIENDTKIFKIKEKLPENMAIASISVSNWKYKFDGMSDLEQFPTMMKVYYEAYMTKVLEFSFTIFYKNNGNFQDFTYEEFEKLYN